MGQLCPDRSSESLKKGALTMSEEKKNYSYRTPDLDIPERLQATKNEHKYVSSVVGHWGIQARQNRLQALFDDQRDNLHSLFEDNSCTCGLRLLDKCATVLDLVLSKHHRNHLTLERDLDPKFRGMVERRLFSMGGPNKIDQAWNDFVLNYLGKEIKNRVFVPVSWIPLRDIPHTVWHQRPVTPEGE